MLLSVYCSYIIDDYRYYYLQLHLESKLDEYCDVDMGSLLNCTLYFQEYLLEKIDSPLILAIDEINQLFEILTWPVTFSLFYVPGMRKPGIFPSGKNSGLSSFIPLICMFLLQPINPHLM